MKIQEINARLAGLAVFRGLREDPVLADYAALIRALAQGPALDVCEAAGRFEAGLFAADTSDLSEYIASAVLECENICARRAARGQLSPALEQALDGELRFLEELSGLGLDDLLDAAGLDAGQKAAYAFLPRWEAHPTGLAAAYKARLSEMGQVGYGMFARHHVFMLDGEGRLTPVRHPDPQHLADLPGYEREREKILANTRGLLAGLPANNVLLYGDAGTGKSSAVKAIANEYAPQGLRLVEVKKNQLYLLPDLMDQLAANPLKFILFIDDLSFASNDDNFAALKAILEGSAGGRAGNIAVYATSNRRHLVRQTFSDRAGDEVDRTETIAEKTSLSERFGLRIPYLAVNKAEFLDMVERMAGLYGVTMDRDALRAEAVKFEMHHPGRTPRTARQFIASLSM